MNQNCLNCQLSFEVTNKDAIFYQKMNVPAPTLCPSCRQQRRLAYRNERTLFKRTCSGSGKSIVSVYQPNTTFPVYDHEYFFGDQWNPFDFGRDFDFKRGFFEQFKDLQDVTPRIVNYSVSNDNAEYGNLSSWNKNCYMLFESDNNRDCLYLENSFHCKNTVDCSFALACELCYDCLDIQNSYNLNYCLNCKNCSDSMFLLTCIGCHHCFGCVNMNNTEYCFFNKQMSKEEYEAELLKYKLHSAAQLDEFLNRFLEYSKQFPHKYMHGNLNENCTGDYLESCKNSEDCYDSHTLFECKYVSNCELARFCYDLDTYGGSEGIELAYECHSVGRGSFNVAFGNNVYQKLVDSFYCDNCINSRYLFGCISIRNSEHCIFNKQYTKEQYEALVPKIIEHMKLTKEWGEFFPMTNSPFAYNETLAQFYYPLTKTQVLEKRLKWNENENPVQAENILKPEQVPDDISLVSDEYLKWGISCSDSHKPFKITKPELDFYRTKNLPLPKLHPNVRYNRRFALRNPRRLYSRNCTQCKVDLQTTYAIDRPEKIYCEKCYLEIVY